MKWKFWQKEEEKEIDILELESLDITSGNFMLLKNRDAFKWYAQQCNVYIVYKVDDMLYFFTEISVVGVKDEE